MAFDPSEFDHDYKKSGLWKKREKSKVKEVDTSFDTGFDSNFSSNLSDNLEEYKSPLKLYVEDTVGKKRMVTGGMAWMLYFNVLRVHLAVALPVGILATLLLMTMSSEPSSILVTLAGFGLYFWTQYYIWSCRHEFSSKNRHRILWICLGFPVSYLWLVMFPTALAIGLVQSIVVGIITQIW